MSFKLSNKSGQAAVEFLIVIGVAFSMLVPGMFLFSQYSETSNQIVIASQVERIGKEMISNVEAIYYYGRNSKTTLKLSYPDKLNSVRLIHKDPPFNNFSQIVFNVSIFGGNSEFVYFTDVNMTADFNMGFSDYDAFREGTKTFVIQSYGTYVDISRK